MTREEAILLSAYTGFLLVQDFSDVHKFCEDTLGRPIWTHEFADKDVQKEIQNKLRPQIMKLIYSTNALRPVSRERVEKVWRGCEKCNGAGEYSRYAENLTKTLLAKYCPHCGRPLTDEAVQTVMERMEAMNRETR